MYQFDDFKIGKVYFYNSIESKIVKQVFRMPINSSSK